MGNHIRYIRSDGEAGCSRLQGALEEKRRIALLRLYSGTIKEGDGLYNASPVKKKSAFHAYSAFTPTDGNSFPKLLPETLSPFWDCAAHARETP